MERLKLKKVLLSICLFLFSIVLIGCSSTIPPATENDPPVITSEPITSAEVNQLYSYDIEATDADGDTLTYSLTTKPSGMTINLSTGLISWTPTSTGAYDVSVIVSDGDQTDVQSFTIHINQSTIYNLKLTPSSQSVSVRAQGTVNIGVENVTDLMAANITLTFDNAVLQYVPNSAAEGDFWLPEGVLLLQGEVTAPGTLNILILADPLEYKSGSGTIITVAFERIASGVTDISFGDTELAEPGTPPDSLIPHTKGGCCSFN